AIKAVVKLLLLNRLVTVVGPAGIGKTTVALVVADRLTNESSLPVRFVDLSGVTDPTLVPMAVAVALGLAAPGDDPIASLIQFVQGAATLLLFDNCEHVIAEVARVVERILRGAKDVAILCTSRERLRAGGETVHALAPLLCPSPGEPVTGESALRHSAIQLFAERALGAQESFEITDRNAGIVVEICRRLDCSPLAMELVAARLGSLDIDMIASSLSRNVLLGSDGRRAGNDRHQSLAAALGWSFGLLKPSEQGVLKRLSVFSGAFTAESAAAVCGAMDLPKDRVFDVLMSLVEKSLLIADTNDSALRFRLLHVTRAFATRELVVAGEAAATQRRHAEHHRDLLLEVGDWDRMSGAAWHRQHRGSTEDVHAALQWAFGPSGDQALAARLLVAALPLGFHFAMHDFETRASTALRVLQSQPERDVLAELRVRTARMILSFQSGVSDEFLKAEMKETVALAERTELPRHRLETYSARAILSLELVDYVGAIQGFEVLQALAKEMDDAYASLVADRIGAQVFHWVGDQHNARIRAERVLRHPVSTIPLTYRQSPIDRGVAMRVVLARATWLEGRPDVARDIALEAVALAADDAPISLCQSLAFAACPIALWRGDLAEAAVFIERLIDISRRHDFRRWYRLGLCFRQSLPATSIVDGEAASPIGSLQRDLLGTLDPEWADETTLARAELGQAGWCNAELIRVAGERVLSRGDSVAAVAAEMRFETALRYARDQNALAWELRAATSLARLQRGREMHAAAREVLEPVHARFKEGFETNDLRAAAALLGR
ncbi:MAG: hypothetical protein ABW136_04395, partial [Steroidobacteraceae bacterium]